VSCECDLPCFFVTASRLAPLGLLIVAIFSLPRPCFTFRDANPQLACIFRHSITAKSNKRRSLILSPDSKGAPPSLRLPNLLLDIGLQACNMYMYRFTPLVFQRDGAMMLTKGRRLWAEDGFVPQAIVQRRGRDGIATGLQGRQQAIARVDRCPTQG
jgi:hypothetical protein